MDEKNKFYNTSDIELLLVVCLLVAYHFLNDIIACYEEDFCIARLDVSDNNGAENSKKALRKSFTRIHQNWKKDRQVAIRSNQEAKMLKKEQSTQNRN